MSLCVAPAVRAQCFATYAVEIILPDCDQPGSSATAIAENGDITGAYSCFFSEPKAFGLFENEFVTIPLVPGYNNMVGRAINPFTEVAGSLQNTIIGGPDQAFLYSNTQTTVLPVLPSATTAEVGGIQQNQPSTVVGVSRGGGSPLTAVLWDDGASPIPLNLSVGPNSVAYAINNSGQIVGWMGDAPFWLFSSNGFIWHEGNTIDLGKPPGGIASVATGISNSSEVCGYHWVGEPGDDQEVLGWKWSNGRYDVIEPLAGYRRCLPKDVNDGGVVVGTLDVAINPSNPNNPQPAFIWRDGLMKSLATLIEPDPNLGLGAAMGINNAGQIVVDGKNFSTGGGLALRLNPLPSLTGDSDFDCDVDVDDLLAVINNWAATPTKGSSLLPAADFNRDQIVNVHDLVIVIQHWTK